MTIDGVEVTNSSNTFDNVIQDLKFTVLRVSDKESDGVTAKKTRVTVEDNIDKAKNINNFVKAYNDLQTTMDDLGKRPVIVGGNRAGTRVNSLVIRLCLQSGIPSLKSCPVRQAVGPSSRCLISASRWTRMENSPLTPQNSMTRIEVGF